MNPTLALARFVAAAQACDIPEPVRDESVRALVDWLGCALGGCLDAALEGPRSSAATAAYPDATLPGLGRRTSAPECALQCALAADALGFAAVHAVEHAVGVALYAALLPLAESHALGGSAVVDAYAIGAEIACRAALRADGAPTPPAQRAACTAIAAAAAGAKLLKLDANGIAHAMRLSASAALEGVAPSGSVRESALAAHRGVVAALLAARGALPALAAQSDDALACFVDSFGEAAGFGGEWQLRQMTYKPYPCAAALHPAIEACLTVRARERPLVRHIATVELRVHPSALVAAHVRLPRNGSEARASLHHAAAVALVDGAAGLGQFDARRLASARVAEMRARIDAVADAALAPYAARVALRMSDGRTLEHSVRCARGSPARPLSDGELSAKFRALAAEVLATDQCERLLALAWNVRSLADIGALVRAAVPEDELEPAELPGSPLIPR